MFFTDMKKNLLQKELNHLADEGKLVGTKVYLNLFLSALYFRNIWNLYDYDLGCIEQIFAMQ